MDLVKKGTAAEIGNLNNFKVYLRWTTDNDFDLAAYYVGKSGKHSLIYFGNSDKRKNLGNELLTGFPYMQLSGDEGIGDQGGDNEEEMEVARLDDQMDSIYIICWDYPQVEAGQPARFAESDVTVAIKDEAGKEHSVKMDSGDMANVCVVAQIDNSNIGNAKLINTSKAGTLKGLSNSSQLWNIIQS